MKYYLIVGIFLIGFSCSAQNLLSNGDFSQFNLGWSTSGDFRYDSRFGVCNSCPGYAYLSNPSGQAENNLSGTIRQAITIPADATNITFSFAYSISTTETSNAGDKDWLYLRIYLFDQIVYSVNLSNTTSTGGAYIHTFPANLPVSLSGQTITIDFYSSTDSFNPTVFRIDDVELMADAGPPGIKTACITWANGSLPDREVINAADNLCFQQLISNYIDVTRLLDLRIKEASELTLNALYRGSIPSSLPSDNFPTFFGDLDGLDSYQLQAVKAMCFLEYNDGRSCLTRDFNKLEPWQVISPGYILRMLYEGWGVTPDTSGFDILNSNQSQFLKGVLRSDYNYGYWKRAYTDGFLQKWTINNSVSQASINPGEFYLILLNYINLKYGNSRPPINDASYYVPNNIQLSTSTAANDITRGIFKNYEQDVLRIPSGGIGLNFTFSYHSDWLDIPTLGYSFTNYSNSESSNFIDERAKEHNFPLGLGWTHSYNIFAQSIYNVNNRDKYIIMRWGDGNVVVYNVARGKFETTGAYFKFKVTAYNDRGNISSFEITDKDQMKTSFVSSSHIASAPAFFQATQVINRNKQAINLEYEAADCVKDPANCAGTSNKRLSSVVDSYSGRKLLFKYQPGTDLLVSVTDNSNRTIRFKVNRRNLNLEEETNAKNNTTKYFYGLTERDNHLLLKIEKPEGNTITNLYFDRKLKQTQTTEYLAEINFSPSYSNSNISTQTTIVTKPKAGIAYSVSYNHNSDGTVTNVASASSNITLTYNDVQNPALPTSVVDNQTNIRQNFQYDNNGNVLRSDYMGGALTQTNSYTYNPENQIKTHTWPNNTTAIYNYDPNGNLRSESASNFLVEYEYFDDGLLHFQTDANKVRKTFAYNKFGNLESVSAMGITFYTAQYDEISRVKSIIDGNLVKTEYEYDANDNTKSVLQDPKSLKIKTSYEYDANDNLISVTPPIGQPTTLTYNQSDDLIEEKKLGLERRWLYNADGSLDNYMDKNHVVFPYSYFPPGDPNEHKLKSNGVQSYIYDRNSHLISSITTKAIEKGSINYSYDQLLRPNKISFTSPTYSSDVQYSYDLSGNVTSLILANEGKTIGYEYDELNRLKVIKDWYNQPIVTYSYRDNGLLNDELLENGVKVLYHYDEANRLDSIYSLKSDGVTLIYYVGCSLDNNGNYIRESSFINWSGDPGVKYNAQADATFTYDKEYNWLLTANGKSSNNDNNGNIRNNAYSEFSGGLYDTHNNLISVNSDGKSRSFLYDAADIRYGMDSLRFTIDHINNGNILAIAKVGETAAKSIYVHSPFGIVCSIDLQTENKIFYLYDFRGSTVATLDEAQAIKDYYKYDPWGKITEASSVPGTKTPFLYVGKYGVMYDSPHLYYMRARYYDPTIGRFLSEDPKWDTNLFPYTGNNPISFIDPNGQNRTSEMLQDGFKTSFDRAYESFTDPGTYSFASEVALYAIPEFRVAESGSYVVYRGIDKMGIVRYIGRTGRKASMRFSEHRNSIGTGKEFLRYEVIPRLNKLSDAGSSVWEQKLINQYGLGKNGGTLLNKINSIAPKNWWKLGIK